MQDVKGEAQREVNVKSFVWTSRPENNNKVSNMENYEDNLSDDNKPRTTMTLQASCSKNLWGIIVGMISC